MPKYLEHIFFSFFTIKTPHALAAVTHFSILIVKKLKNVLLQHLNREETEKCTLTFTYYKDTM